MQLSSRRSIIRAAASTTTRAPTPTRSAGRRRASRCRCCATRARSSTRCSAPAPRLRNARGGGARTGASSTRSSSSIDRLKTQLGASDRARLTHYLDDVREIERRIQNIEAFNRSGETPRAAERAGGRARFVRRAREADVRPAGGSARVGSHARVRVQDVARRVGPRLTRRPASPPDSTTRRTMPSGRNAFSTSRRSTSIT